MTGESSLGTPYAALLARLARDPALPLLTDVDLATGDRVELSVASAANGAAKAAHLVAGPGRRARPAADRRPAAFRCTGRW